MLSDLYQFISTQNWYRSIGHIIRLNDSKQKIDHETIKELAKNHINKSCESEIFEGIFVNRTPLEDYLSTEAGYGIKGKLKNIKALIFLGADVNLKNAKGDNALMFYLKSVNGIQNGNEKNNPSLKIIKFLISEGSDLSPNLKGETPLTFAKEKSFEPLVEYMQGKIRKDTPHFSAIKIQRCWRGYKYLKNKNQNGLVSKNQAITPHPKLSFNPPIPQIDNSIDPKKAEAWVNLHDKEDQILAKQVLEKIDHVSFERFLFGLKKTVEKWNTYIMSRPSDQRDYVLLLDARDGKSSHWVTSFALPFLDHPPTQVITWDKRQDINKRIKHVVFIDDAIYSGNQMSACIRDFLRTKMCPEYQHFLNAECHLIAPFISETGLKRLSKREVNILYHEIIPDFSIEGLNISGKTATYFAHKIAQDGISTIGLMTTGETIRGKEGIRFIPPTREPYKPGYEEWLKTQKTS